MRNVNQFTVNLFPQWEHGFILTMRNVNKDISLLSLAKARVLY